MELLKQNIGIDVSKDTFDATFMDFLTGQLQKVKRTQEWICNKNLDD